MTASPKDEVPWKKPKLSREMTGHYEFMLDRLEQVVALLNAGERHMATAKLLADISRIKGALGRVE